MAETTLSVINLLQYKAKLEKCILALLNISVSDEYNEDAIIQTIINEVVELTSSDCGYLHLFNSEDESIELKVWSESTMRLCTASYDNHYPLKDAGVWADCARSKKPVIHNNYPELTTKKGLPKGHFPILRHMSIPVIEDGKVVVIIGVGNKLSDYDEFDVQQVELISYSLWRILKNKRYETAIKRMNEESKLDYLTETYTRREFENILTRIIENSSKTSVMAYIDMDNFKVINDTCGHCGGDLMLKRVTNTIKNKVRKSDAVGRLGGDEFGILFRDCSLEAAKKVCESIQTELNSQAFLYHSRRFPIRLSIGLTEITKNLDETLVRADAACYLAKEFGKNQIKLYTDTDDDLSERRQETIMASNIPSYLRNKRLKLYVQPVLCLKQNCKFCKISINGKKCQNYEVLLRILDKDSKANSPSKFLAAANRYSYASLVDQWVVENTLMLFDDHKYDDVSMFFINLSTQALCDKAFLQFVSELLKYSANGHRICFEITETIAINNYQTALEMMTSLKEQGCHFALDDFGSGFSSFGYLKTLPVDFIKIDGMFIKDIVNDLYSATITKSINDISHSLGMMTIAEVVENAETQAVLNEMSVDFIQGYHYCRPFPVEDIALNHA
jgi:diguanylate cyclase (GGDEF)-like protein